MPAGGELTCRKCGSPLCAREDRFVINYFLVGHCAAGLEIRRVGDKRSVGFLGGLNTARIAFESLCARAAVLRSAPTCQAHLSATLWASH